jgi:hypothetical protein
MSIFLLSLTFVLVFVPGMLQPFSGGAQAETPAVNRAADDLTQGRLGDASTPYVLDGEWTAELFTAGVPADCRYEGTTLSERLGSPGATSNTCETPPEPSRNETSLGKGSRTIRTRKS